MRDEGLIRKGKKTPETFRKHIGQYLNSGVFTKSPNYRGGVDLNNNTEIIINETYWIGESRRVIYPETNDVLQWVHDCSYDVEGLVLTPPFDCFILSPPDDSILPSGMMIVWVESDDGWLRMRDGSDKWTGTNPAVTRTRQSDCIGFPYIFLCWESRFGTETMIIDMEDIKRILGNETPAFLSKRSNTDVEKTRKILRMVIGMLVYIQASKGRALVHGIPRQSSQSLKGIMPKPQAHYLAAVNPEGKRRTGHLVSGHFRVYRHPRYYRSDEWKNRPIGSRVEWVDSYIKGDIDPHTLIKKG